MPEWSVSHVSRQGAQVCRTSLRWYCQPFHGSFYWHLFCRKIEVPTKGKQNKMITIHNATPTPILLLWSTSQKPKRKNPIFQSCRKTTKLQQLKDGTFHHHHHQTHRKKKPKKEKKKITSRPNRQDTTLKHTPSNLFLFPTQPAARKTVPPPIKRSFELQRSNLCREKEQCTRW